MTIGKTTKLCLLGFAALLIWAVNIRSLLRKINMQPEAGKELSEQIEVPLLVQIAEFDFKPLERDPFNVIAETTRNIPVMPFFLLKGVILSGKTPLALIEFNNGPACPLKTGEEFWGVKVKKITRRDVVIEFRGREEAFPVAQ